MTPLDRTRIEKAAADCGLDLPPELQEGGMILRSTAFPETVEVRLVVRSAKKITKEIDAFSCKARRKPQP